MAAVIGRDAELRAFSEALARVPPRGAVIVAAPGLGGRRLAAAFAEHASAAGHRAVTVAADHSLTGVPLGALAPLLSADLSTGDGSAVDERTLLTWAHRALASAATDARSGEDEGAASRRFRGLVLVIEDAHLLDDTSAAAVAQAQRAGTVIPILLLTPASALPAPLQHLGRGGAVRLELLPLADREVAALVAERLGGTIDGRLPPALRSMVGGSPLHLGLTIDASKQTGAIVEHVGVWRLARTLPVHDGSVEVVEAGLRDLAADERELAELLAVADGDLPLAMVRALTGPTALEALERAGVLQIGVAAEAVHVGLTDPAVATVLARGLHGMRRIELAGRLVAAALGRDANEIDELRLATWRVVAADPGPADELVTAAMRAYDESRHREAELLLRAALHRGRRFDAELCLGEVLHEQGRAEDAAETFEALKSIAKTDEQRALATMCVAINWFDSLGRQDEAIALVDREADAHPGTAGGAELRGLHATFLLFRGEVDTAISEAEPLLTATKGRPRIQASIALAGAYTVSGRTVEAFTVAGAAFEERVAIGYAPIIAPAGLHLIVQTFALAEGGHLAQARALAESVYDVCVATHNRDGQAWVALLLSRVFTVEGRLTTAVRWAREAAAVFDEVGLRAQMRWAFGMLLLASGQAGDRASARYARQALDGWSEPYHVMMEPEVLRARGWDRCLEGDLAGAAAWFSQAADLAAETGQRGLEVHALHDLVRIGDHRRAAGIRAAAARVDSVLAPLQIAQQEATSAADPDALADIAQRFSALDAQLYAAEALLAAAAITQRSASARAAAELGRRAAEHLGRCEGAATPAIRLAVASGLTAREREIASLVAAGWTSKRAAAHLGVSVRTVDNLLQRAYRKLGVSNRGDLSDVLG